jgi:hypothetical protein
MNLVRMFAMHGVSALLSVLLLLTSNFDCWAQFVTPRPESECCNKGPCKRSPGQASHSSCKDQPGNSERLAPPDTSGQSSRVAFAATHEPFDGQLPQPQAAVATAIRIFDYSPPDLFLQNSSLLI